MKKQLITVMLLLFAFALGYLAKPVVTIELPRNDALKAEEQEDKPVDPVDQWQDIRAKVQGKAIRGISEGIIHEVAVTISGSSQVYRMPVNPTEYLILRPGDTIGIRVLKESGWEKGRMEWIRNQQGYLDLDLARPIVVVDPGHGGIDLGQGSNDQWIEKDMNLIMSERMAKSLEEVGIRVILTRNKDRYISLYDRVAIANYVQADMLVSNHVNRMDEEASGVEVLYSSHSDREFANELAGAISTDAHPVYRVYRRRSYDIPGQDYYFLHKYTTVPSYIIEYAFADNETDSLYFMEHWEDMVDRAAATIIEELR